MFKLLENSNPLKRLGIIFVIFLIVGCILGYFISTFLNKDETAVVPKPQTNTESQASAEYRGIVTYLGKEMYQQDKIEYSLTDLEGNDIVLLRANDQKLSLAQGMNVIVRGRKLKTIDGKQDVLQVSEITLKNGSN